METIRRNLPPGAGDGAPARWPTGAGPIPRRWLVLACLALLLTLPARAAMRDFEVFDVFVGYDGILPESSWFPVVCEIENKGPGFNAVFEITSGQAGQTRQMPLELPTGTHKRFVIPVFSAGRYMGGWNARLLDERGRTRAEAIVRQVRKTSSFHVPLVGALSRTMNGRPVLPEVANQPRPELKLEVSRLQPDLFPDNPIALEGLDTIYLNSEQAMEDRLRVNQVKALLAWLHGGGHLVVGVEQITHVNGTEWLRQLLPCELTGMASVNAHAELHDWVTSTRRIDGREYSFQDTVSSSPTPQPRRTTGRVPIQPATTVPIPNPFARLPLDPQFPGNPLQIATVTLRDGQVVMGSEAEPLVITARRGRGQITVLTFSPERDPFLSWKLRPDFWAKLANVPPVLLTDRAQDRYYGYSVDGVFGAMIDSKQVRKLPVGWLLLLLVGYLAVIGPIDRWWLKKINKQMLTWITFPVYVVSFSLLIYFIGYKLRAGESEWNELHVVDVIPTGEQADLRGRTFASVYSPANARYPLASELPYAALRGEYLASHGGGQEASRARVIQKGNTFAAEIFVPVWTSQLYVNDWLNRAPLPLSVTVARQGDRVQVKVDSRLDQRLHPVRLFLDGQVLEVGEVAARQTKTVTLDKSGQTIANYVRNYGNMFQNAVNLRRQAFGENRTYINDVPASAMATTFLTQLSNPNDYNNFVAPPGFDLSELVDRGDAVLLAWAADSAPVKGFNQFKPRRSHRDTLWRVVSPAK